MRRRWLEIAMLLTSAWVLRDSVHAFFANHVKPQLLRALDGGLARSLRDNAVPLSGEWDIIVNLKKLGARDYRLTRDLRLDEGNYQRVTEGAWPMRASPESRFLIGLRGEEGRMHDTGCEPVWKAMDGKEEGKIVIALCSR